MPKIRGIKPDYWTDEDVVDLSVPARLLFIGLWTFACDNGHLQDKPKQIKMRIFPGDDVNASELLRELAASGRITRADGWITIPNLTEHQRVDRRYFTTCDKEGCDDPPEKVSQRKSRRVHAEHTSGAQGVHDVGTPCARVDGDGDGDGDGEMMVIADADASEPTSRELAVVDRPDVDHLCNVLADAVMSTGEKRPTVTARWHTEARLMLDLDGRTAEHVEACIRWLYLSNHRDAVFWRPNIRAMPKLRAEYGRLLALSQRNQGASRQQDTDDLFDQAMRRARAADGR